MSLLNDKTLVTLASVVTVAGGAFSAWKYWQEKQVQNMRTIRSDVEPGGTLFTGVAAATVLPSADPTDPGFSNYARRSDLFEPLKLPNGALAYGQTIGQ